MRGCIALNLWHVSGGGMEAPYSRLTTLLISNGWDFFDDAALAELGFRFR